MKTRITKKKFVESTRTIQEIQKDLRKDINRLRFKIWEEKQQQAV